MALAVTTTVVCSVPQDLLAPTKTFRYVSKLIDNCKESVINDIRQHIHAGVC